MIVKLVGISLGDFLCPHGFLHGTVRDMLADPKSCIKFRVLLVDHNSAVATSAPCEEEPDHFLAGGGGFEKTKCHDELKTATHVAEGYKTTYPSRFQHRTYAIAPLCFVVIVGETMFMESYHYAGRGGEAAHAQDFDASVARQLAQPALPDLFPALRSAVEQPFGRCQ